MTIPAPADGNGTTLTFSGFSSNIISINPPDIKRAAIDKTHLGTTGAMDSMPAKLVDAGELSCEVEFDPAALPPIAGSAGSLVVVFATTTPATWTWANSFMTGWKVGAVKSGEKFTATATWKLTAKPVIS